MTVKSSYLIGSDPVFPTQDVSIDASPETVAAGSSGALYLYHATSTLSLLDQFVAAMTSAGVAAPAAVLLESGKVRISSSGVFTVTWTDQHLADMMGFSGDPLTGATSYTADNISKYIWVPGRGHTPEESPIGVGGQKRYMRSQTVAPDASQVTFLHTATTTTETLRFDVVPKEMFETASGLGGEFTEFFETVLVGGARWQHYEYVNYSSTSTTAATLTGALGPYVMRGMGNTRPFERDGGAPRVEKYYNLSIPMLLVNEYA